MNNTELNKIFKEFIKKRTGRKTVKLDEMIFFFDTFISIGLTGINKILYTDLVKRKMKNGYKKVALSKEKKKIIFIK